MRMKNNDVVREFLNGGKDAQSHTGNLYIEGNKLVNYNTTIAQWDDGQLILNKTRYSVSTSKIQGMLYGVDAVDSAIIVTDVPFDTYDLLGKVKGVA